MTSLTAIFAQIAIPFFAVPLTLQIFAVCLSGFLLGAWKGSASVLVYLSLGAVGLPVFAGWQGSLGTLVGPTGGFLIGFLPLVIFCGLSPKNKILTYLFPMIGLILCHFCGVLWFSFQSGNSIFASFLFSCAPYITKDVLSCVFAKMLSQKISAYI